MPRNVALCLCLLPSLAIASVVGQSRQAQANRPLTVAEIVRQASGAVVQIVVSDESGKEYALGSGFIVSADGEIVTNYHVIKGAHSAVAKLADGSFFPVDGVLAADADRDLVLLKVKGKGLPFLTLDSTRAVEVGDHVVAIGSPLGLEGTVSDGLVSAFREEAPNKRLIQTTAPVSHGNSGGPLLDMHGKVVGVIAAGVDPEEGQNLNFAIPSDEVKSLLSMQGKLTSFESVTKNQESDTEQAGSQPDVGEQKGMEQLRAIAEAIKKCPLYQGIIPALYGSEFRDGPPSNVVWNVEASSSVRARYLGTIEYDVPFWLSPGEPPTDNSCAKQGMEKGACVEGWQGIARLYLQARANPRRYRYEFDVTPSGLDYLRGFDKLKQMEDEPWASSESLEKCANWAINSVTSSVVPSQ